ncbi:unnamed protein product, partial [Linum tenue]
LESQKDHKKRLLAFLIRDCSTECFSLASLPSKSGTGSPFNNSLMASAANWVPNPASEKSGATVMSSRGPVNFFLLAWSCNSFRRSFLVFFRILLVLLSAILNF